MVLEPDDLFLGTVNEDWATESMPGDIFLLGTHAWQIRQIGAASFGSPTPRANHPVLAGQAPSARPSCPGMSLLRSTLDGFPQPSTTPRACAWLRSVAPIDEAAVERIVAYVAAGRAVLGLVPTQDDLVFERFFDEVDGMHLVVHSPRPRQPGVGAGAAQAVLRLVRLRAAGGRQRRRRGAVAGAAAQLPAGRRAPVPRAATVRKVLTQAVLSPPSPMVQSRWRWNLSRSLIVLRFKGGRRNPHPSSAWSPTT